MKTKRYSSFNPKCPPFVSESLPALQPSIRPSNLAHDSWPRVSQPKGCHRFWNEPSVLALTPTTVFRCTPSASLELSDCGDPADIIRFAKYTHSGVWLVDKFRRTVSTRLLSVGDPLKDAHSPPLSSEQFSCRQLRARDSVTLLLHPCQLAADFLTCTRPPDFVPSRGSRPVSALAPAPMDATVLSLLPPTSPA